MRKFLIFVATGFLVLPFCRIHAQGEENRGEFTLSDIKVDIALRQDSSMLVREEIIVEFSEPRHGIFRNIPVKYQDDNGFKHNLRFDLLRVENEKGERMQHSTHRKGGDVVIKIGDPVQEVGGRQTYLITYEIRRGVRFFDDHAEIYWNPVGTGWPTTIDQAIVTLSMPRAVVFTNNDMICYTGFYGSKDQNCTQTVVDASHVQFETMRQLSSFEGLTIAIKFPLDTISQPTLPQRILWFVQDNWGFSLPILAFAAMLYLFLNRGKELNLKKTIITQFDPPDNLTPGELAYLMHERYSSDHVTADIVNLAVKGYLKINEISSFASSVKKSLITAAKIVSLVVVLPVAVVVTGILVNVDGWSLINAIIPVVFLIIFILVIFKRTTKIKKVLTNVEYELENIKDWRGTPGLTAHEQAIMSGLFEDKVGGKVEMAKLKDFHFSVESARSKLKKQIKLGKYFEEHFLNFRSIYVVAGVAISAISIFAGAASERLDILIGGIASGIILVGFGVVMSKKTVAGAEATRWARGFRDYINTAERYRVKFQEDEHIFERILPYAMVFGLADKWAKAFEGIYGHNPDWYSSSAAHAFSPALFASSLNDSFGSATQSVSAPPSSSSSGFSGGGGSSGGGGGGGGGGSW